MPKRIDLSPEQEVIAALENKLRAKDAAAADLKDSVKRARHDADKWREKFDELLAIKEPIKCAPLCTPSRIGRSSGVAVAMWSDWHVAERIERQKVRGLNAFSPNIARKRAAKCADSTLRLFRHVRESYSVDTLMLYLGGDFITGYLHPELAQTNYMGPIEEGRFAEELLIGCINKLAEENGIKKLRIVCQRGNHGRTTPKMQYKNDFETSYETWIYAHLASLFKSPRIDWDIPQSDVHCVEVLPDWRMRVFHGHQVKYNDGIGGIGIPLNKWESKQDITRACAHNLMGHYHTYMEGNTRTTLNGSLKGYDEYAASAGFPYQDPLQAFLLIDADRRMVAQRMPIFCT